MTTTINNDTFVLAIKDKIQQEIEKAIEGAIEEALLDIEKQIRGEIGNLSLSLLKYYEVRTMEDNIVITVNNKVGE